MNVETITQNLTPYQMSIMTLIRHGLHVELQLIKSMMSEEEVKDIFETLEKAEYIYAIADTYLCQGKGLDLWDATSSSTHFVEFYDLFPSSVQRPDGTKDYLRNNKEKSMKVYNKLARLASKHEEIMNALKFEIEYRKKNGTLSYMKRMTNWLASNEWESWIGLMNEAKNSIGIEIKAKYGQDLI